LAALLLVAISIVGGFRNALRSVATPSSTPGAIGATTSVEPTGSTTVTGTIAVTRVDAIQLLADAGAGAAVVATVKKGAQLQVLNRTDTWFRVKDAAGHIGWIANSSQSVEIRKK
jgi:uncharacterized protein YgiM (DUF1202 family)